MQRLVQTPYRGLIYDRKDQLLVQNTPVYDLLVVPREVKQLDSARFCALLQIPLEDLRVGLRAARKYSRNKPSPLVQNLTTPDLAAISDRLADFPGFRVQARMARAYRTPSAEIVASQGIVELDVVVTADEVAEMRAGAVTMRAMIDAWRAEFEAEMDEARRD